MNDKEPKELHLRVTPGCFAKIQAIAEQDEVPMAVVCRYALWQYIRQRLPEAPRNPGSD